LLSFPSFLFLFVSFMYFCLRSASLP
jgi:hypothetical protein